MQTWTTAVLLNQISFSREPAQGNLKHCLFYRAMATVRDELRCNCFGRELFGSVLTDLDV